MKYKNNKRPIFGVIAAQAADMEQHQILNGIIEQAQNFNIDIAVFTNIYNPNEPNPSLYSENEIYESNSFAGTRWNYFDFRSNH